MTTVASVGPVTTVGSMTTADPVTMVGSVTTADPVVTTVGPVGLIVANPTVSAGDGHGGSATVTFYVMPRAELSSAPAGRYRASGHDGSRNVGTRTV